MAAFIVNISESESSSGSLDRSGTTASHSESISVAVARGMFAKEFKASQALIDSSQETMQSIKYLHENPPHCWTKYRNPIVLITGIATTVFTVTTIIGGAYGLRENIPTLVYSIAGIGGAALLAGACFFYHRRKTNTEEVVVYNTKIFLKKRVKKHNFMVQEAYHTEEFCRCWKKFVAHPQDKKISTLFKKFRALTLVDDNSAFSLLDELCAKVKTGPISSQWKLFKTQSDNDTPLTDEFWKRLHRAKPAQELLKAYRSMPLKSKEKSVVDDIVNRVRNGFDVILPDDLDSEEGSGNSVVVASSEEASLG